MGIRDAGTIPEVMTEQEVPETVEANRAEQPKRAPRDEEGRSDATDHRKRECILFRGLITIFKHAHDKAPYPFPDDRQ